VTTVEREMAKTPSNRADRILWLLASVIILGFYCWTGTSSSDPSDWDWGIAQSHPGPENYYDLLASGFLSGHLYLPVEPPPRLLALRDPFGADTTGIRLQDASLYHGKYYLYYGPTPAITLFLPWRIVTGHGMPHSFAVLLYTWIGFLFSYLFLFLLLDSAKIRVPQWIQVVLTLSLGVGNLAPVLLRRPGAIYEVAIAAGFCWFLAGLYLFARWLILGDNRRWIILAAGLCFGLAAGCRSHYGLTAAIILVVSGLYFVLRRESVASEFSYFAGAILFCGLALAAYNYARFDSPFEFGTTYQLTGSIIARVMLHGRHVVPTLYFYLFSRPLLMDQFPFLQLMRPLPAPFGHPEWMPWINLGEEFAGILTVIPMCVAGLFLPLSLLHAAARKLQRSVKLAVLVTWGAGVAMLLFIAFAGAVGMRYHLDYAPELLIAGLFGCLWLASTSLRPEFARQF
jgi:hypothetical protein